MSQIVYTELEALPLRWPYLQLEPLDKEYTQTWPTDQTFNVSTSSTTYTPPDTGSPVEIPIYGVRRLGQILPKQSTASYELLSNIEVSIRKVGNPGSLKTELYTLKESNDYINDELTENISDVSSTYPSVSGNTWKAVTRSFDGPLKITSLLVRITSGSPSLTPNLIIVTANPNGSPSSTILYGPVTVSYNTWHTLSPPLELAPGLYSFVLYNPSGTTYMRQNPTLNAAFGTIHSYWVSTNAGSSWSSNTEQAPVVVLKGYTKGYEPDQKLDEYVTPASAFGTSTAWTSIYYSGDARRYLKTKNIYIVFSSPDSPDTSNCYMIQRGNSYSTQQNLFNLRNIHSMLYDGSTTEYKYADVLVRKTYNEYAGVPYIFDKQYYLGPGSYGPKASITIKAVSGTVYALPVTGEDDKFITIPASEKSTTSTSYTTLTWDTSSGAPEIYYSTVKSIRLLVRGNGAYNQVSFTPRIYYDKNPVTPRDFGFTELYLMRLRAEAAGTLVRVNDTANIYFTSSGDTVVIDPAFRAPIRKLYVLVGKVTADLLGVM